MSSDRKIEDKRPTGTVSVHEVLAYVQSDRYFTKRQLTEYLPISTRTIESHLEEIPHFRLFNSIVLFKKSEIDDWVQRYRQEKATLAQIADEVIESVMDSGRR